MNTRRRFLTAASLVVTGSLLQTRFALASAIRFAASPFTLGVASGYPLSDSVVLWTRLVQEPRSPDGGMPREIVPVEWEIARDERMTSIVRHGVEYATPEWAHSVHVEPEGLESSTDYWYRFTAGGIRSPIGRTRTAPARGASLRQMRFALVCCQHYEHGYFTAYRHLVSDSPELILHVGDYIYEGNAPHRVRNHDLPVSHTLEDYRIRHAVYKTDADLAAAHAACPWLLVWDDHDVSNDYAGDVSEEAEDPQVFLARRAAAYRAYYEHMPLPRWAVPSGPDMHMFARYAYGDLAGFLLLDQRQYRSPEACPPAGRAGGHRVDEKDCPEIDSPTRTMLGAHQEQWAFAELSASTSRWNLLAQGTLMAYLNEEQAPAHRYWTDAWSGYPAARARLLNYLSDHSVANPVVLSGDIHAFVVSGLNRVAGDLESPVVAPEFVTSSISTDANPELYFINARQHNPNLLLATGERRGYIRFDLTHERLRADLIAMDSVKISGSPRRTLASYVVEPGKPAPVRV